jgi:hypothetical protein
MGDFDLLQRFDQRVAGDVGFRGNIDRPELRFQPRLFQLRDVCVQLWLPQCDVEFIELSPGEFPHLPRQIVVAIEQQAAEVNFFRRRSDG